MNRPSPQTGEYLVMLTPVRPGMVVDGPLPDEIPALAGHLAWLEHLAARGSLVLAGRTQEADPSGFGIVVLRAGSRQEAASLMDRDPAVAGGLMKVQVHEFRVAVHGYGGHP